MNTLKRIMCIFFNGFVLAACSSVPDKPPVVKNFELEKYLGKWYEIARFDFYFEKNMDNTTAQYSLNEDGTVRVVNRGYNYIKKKWKEAVGKARFAGNRTEADLKVSFFGPFYGAYRVIALDQAYQYALVAGKNLDYLWILSRQTTIPDEIKSAYLKLAEEAGFDISKLIWVKHNSATE